MSEYIRTTRECSVNQLRPKLLHAIQIDFQQHQLGDLETETLMCCETISEKKNTSKIISWLNGTVDTIIYTGMLLTSEWLVWALDGDRSGLLLNTANLKLIRAEFYSSRFPKDVGLGIVGYVGDAKERIRGYVGMGEGLVTQKFCEVVKQAISKANPPTQKGFFGLRAG